MNQTRPVPRSAIFLAVILSLSFSSYSHALETLWQVKKNNDGIQVRVREVPGSSILEYSGKVTVKIGVNEAVAFYEQEKRMPEWFYNALESRLIEARSPREKILYFAIAMPWPVKDRDSVYLREQKVSPDGVVEYFISALPDAAPPQGDRIRCPYLKGYWRFTPLKEGGTEVYYQQHGEVGGHIPAWLVNKLAVNIPYNTLRKFREVSGKS